MQIAQNISSRVCYHANPSNEDQEHLDEEGYRLLAEAMFHKISEIEENAG